jgi:hypothetical protein
MSKELLAREALAQIPKLLTLLDRNPHSPTYGCFDRNYWHYKIIDFPSGMAQEFVWPLALAYDTRVDNNPFYQRSAVRDWVHAGITFAARSSHRDGSCDDYFPFERAGGAAAFSLLSCVESYRMLGLDNQQALRFFELRGDWLAAQHETGRLSNHQALIALALEVTSNVLGTNKWVAAINERLQRVLSWQHDEGWFEEYGGYDPGYDTLTIWALARLNEINPTPRLKQAIERAVNLSLQVIHPDGSYGGEYGSRNTYNFFPDAFEIVGRWMPEALAVNDLFLRSAENRTLPCYSDDHIIGHHCWNYLLAFRNFIEPRPTTSPARVGRLWLERAGFLIDRRETTELYLGLNKAGTLKLFRDGALVASDTQVSIRVGAGSAAKTAVAHLLDSYRCDIGDETISIEGSMGWAKQELMTSWKLILLRVSMLTFGRFFPNAIRSFLQARLISGKSLAPFAFKRTLTFREGKWVVTDEVSSDDWSRVTEVGIGCDQTSIYVVMSRTFQEGQLAGWLNLTELARILRPGEKLKIERAL